MRGKYMSIAPIEITNFISTARDTVNRGQLKNLDICGALYEVATFKIKHVVIDYKCMSEEWIICKQKLWLVLQQKSTIQIYWRDGGYLHHAFALTT